MDWQQMAALSIVAVTAVLLVRARFARRRLFDFQRNTHCGCTGALTGQAQKGSIVFRARKGAGREVVVKMK